MQRSLHIWLVFVLCLSVVLAAMAWVSATALRLSAAETEARQQAIFEENIRLALWRMDSFLTDLLGQEGSHPYFHYTAFYKAERAYSRMFEELKQGEVLMPSPLLTQASPYVLLHFQFDPGGNLSSPQVPAANVRALAQSRYTTREMIETAARRLEELRKILARDKLLAALRQPDQGRAVPTEKPVVTQLDRPASSLPSQEQRASNEWLARSQNVVQQTAFLQRPCDLRQEMVRPVWMDGLLILTRQVTVRGQSYVQGCWLDWLALKKWLLESVKDLLPEAGFEIVNDEQPLRPSRMLAALPVRLLPGPAPSGQIGPAAPVLLSLVIAWVCVLLGAAAVVALLKGAVSLSERRGAFVSAVTHELRSPLTTFKMYSEMLAEGMIQDEEKRQHYFKTLCTEANRLDRLVENVLVYARLERGRAVDRTENVALSDLLDRVRPRLAERAEQAGMKLLVETGACDLSLSVQTDASAVEQILFNLVDNACKYTSSTEDRTVHLQVDSEDGFAVLRVRDHGPGITRADARSLFQPFHKSETNAEKSAPGVGLGLALSRRLARQMRGNLCLDRTIRDGACFVLTLPFR